MATGAQPREHATAQALPRRARWWRFLVRGLLFLIVLLVVLAAGAVWWGYSQCRKALAQLDGSIGVSGLQARVEVKRDARGVPHLRAKSLDDLMFAQGYVTAQDRLWQMDLSRRLAFGELAEVFGEAALRFDVENRPLGFRQAAERAVQEMDPDSRRLLAAYANGVNEFISTHRDRLPIEFRLVRYQPRPWQEIDCLGVALNMSKFLSTTWPDKLMRERIRSKLSPELYADLFPDHSPLDHPVAESMGTVASGPAWREQVVPQGGIVPAKAAGQIQMDSRLRGNDGGFHPAAPAYGNVLAAAGFGVLPPDSIPGSNNWVVSGAHTQSGKPLLANDPHLSHSVPSVRYMIHLQAPDLNVSGVSLPGLPLVVIGHNQRIAWGMTNTAPDVQDLYSESFNLSEPNKYLHNGVWVDAEVRDEVIKVHNQRDLRLTVKTTRHGPVISHEGNRDLALQWTTLQPHAVRFPFLKIDRAENWPQFTDALRDFTGPMQNFVYADVDGNIGFYAAGWVPIRASDDGTFPSIGSTDDHDWTGYIPFESLPHAYNPPGGIIATANGRVVPDDYPYFITHNWDASYRTARIFQLLESKNSLTVPDMLRIQTDIHTLQDEWLAKQLLAASHTRPPASADAQYALTLLGNWDGEARADSAATLVSEVTRHALLDRIVQPKLGDDLSGYRWPMSTIFLQTVLEHQWTRWLPPGDADFNATLMASLEDAVQRIPALVGSHRHDDWQWGKTIPLTFQHRLSNNIPLFGRFLNIGPVPQAGTGSTVKQTTPTLGPSMRMVVDFSNFDASVENITLGESEEFLSPYYKDQFDAWYNGRSFPMLFSDAAVESGTTHLLVLEPRQPR